jgi:hypothetical protein
MIYPIDVSFRMILVSRRKEMVGRNEIFKGE